MPALGNGERLGRVQSRQSRRRYLYRCDHLAVYPGRLDVSYFHGEQRLKLSSPSTVSFEVIGISILGVCIYGRDSLKAESLSKEKRKSYSCFVSASSGVDITVLIEVLADLNVRVMRPDETPPPGDTSARTLRKLLRPMDFVCCVLSGESGSSNVLFEAGVAVGLGRPVYLVLEPNSLLPVALESCPSVRASVLERDSLSFHLTLFLNNFRQSARAATTISASRQLRPLLPATNVGELRQRVENLPVLESEVGAIVYKALTRLGVEVQREVHQEHGDVRVDFVAWFPQSSSDIGNPVAIEVKGMGYSENNSMQDAIGRMWQYLSTSRIRSGLIISTDPKIERRITLGPSRYVFVLPLSEFLTLIEKGTLLRELQEIRNRFVHTGKL